MMKNKLILFFIFLFFITIWEAKAQDASLLLHNAKAAIEKNDYETALRDLNAILSREPGNEAALTQRARAFVRQEKNEPALADAEAVLRVNPKNLDALNVRGIVKERKKDFDGALADYNQAIALDPTFSKAYRNRAGVKSAKKMSLQEVLRDYDAYIKLAPQDASGYSAAGNFCLTNSGAATVCAAYFDAYKKLEPQSFVGYFGYALTYSNVNRTIADKNFLRGEVVQNFRRAMELEPKNKSIPLNLGRLQHNLGDYDAAVISHSQAIALDSKEAWAYAMRGDCYFFKNDYDRAIADYTKAIEIDPKYAGAYKFRSKASWEKGARLKYGLQDETGKAFWRQVAEDYAKAARFSNQDYQTFKEFSETLFALGYPEETKKKFYDEMIAVDPNDVCARYFRLQSSSYFRNKAAWDELINRYDGKNGTNCYSDAALWIGRNFADGDRYSGIAPDYGKAREYYNLALKFPENERYVRNWMAQLPSESYGARNPSAPNMTEVRRKQERTAQVDRLHLQYSNEIVARSAKFNDYSKQRGNELDMTPPLKARLLSQMKEEMQAIIDTANKALSEIGNEINLDQKNYYLRIVETGRAKLAQISQPDYR